VNFDPLQLEQHRVPEGWRFVAAFSTVPAPKSGSAKGGYNTLTERARDSLARVTLALDQPPGTTWATLTGMMAAAELVERASANLPPALLPNFRHIVTEQARVLAAVEAMDVSSLEEFGELMNASHQSLRDDLGVSTRDLDEAVSICRDAGAAGARLTGAGFGGSIVALCDAGKAPDVMEALRSRYYQPRGAARSADKHCFVADPAAGAGIAGNGG
jgi:galactokinase